MDNLYDLSDSEYIMGWKDTSNTKDINLSRLPTDESSKEKSLQDIFNIKELMSDNQVKIEKNIISTIEAQQFIHKVLFKFFLKNNF